MATLKEAPAHQTIYKKNLTSGKTKNAKNTPTLLSNFDFFSGAATSIALQQCYASLESTGVESVKNITKVCKLLLGLREMGFRVYVFRFLNYSRTEFV